MILYHSTTYLCLHHTSCSLIPDRHTNLIGNMNKTHEQNTNFCECHRDCELPLGQVLAVTGRKGTCKTVTGRKGTCKTPPRTVCTCSLLVGGGGASSVSRIGTCRASRHLVPYPLSLAATLIAHPRGKIPLITIQDRADECDACMALMPRENAAMAHSDLGILAWHQSTSTYPFVLSATYLSLECHIPICLECPSVLRNKAVLGKPLLPLTSFSRTPLR